MPSHADAMKLGRGDLVFGLSLGFGGAGIDKSLLAEDGINEFDVSRSESPGVIGISVETFLNEKWGLALSHRRGVRIGPFSMDTHFTGIIARRYFLRTPPVLADPRAKDQVVVQTWTPYVGIGAGVARGHIKREKTFVDSLSSSGIYMGGHVGVDYHYKPRLILRPELYTSASIIDTSKQPATLKEYGLVMGFLFKF